MKTLKTPTLQHQVLGGILHLGRESGSYNTQSQCVCFGAQSMEHGNVLSEKINFSAPGGQKVAIFGMEDLDPQYFDVSNFSVPPDPPYMSKNANMCYF